MNIEHLVAATRWCAEESSAFVDGPLAATFVESPEDTSVVVIAGDNASGKSLLFRMLSQVLRRDHDTTGVTLSIRERAGTGLEEMAGIRRAFMYGDEHDQSTGSVSARTVVSGFRDQRSYGRAVLMLDEPELGLSEGYVQALGRYVGGKSRDVPGVVVVTHSRSLVREIIAGSGTVPHLAYCSRRSDDRSVPRDLLAWVSQVEPRRSIEELLALPDRNLSTWREVNDVLRNKD